MTMLQLGTSLGSIDPTPVLAADIGLMLVKAMFVIAGLMYVIFAIIVTRQVHIMKNTLITPFSPAIMVLGYVHLVVSLGVFAFFILL